MPPHSVNQPNPAIVAQVAVKRLPRLALWLFCLAYILAGFVGRVPWKNADISSFGYMLTLAVGNSDWWQPMLGGLLPEVPALLPYWLGAWAITLSPDGLSADLAARVPFMLLLALALIATWYGTYYLARSPLAQPVAFAFGGEAEPTDYARALADAGLLAMMACLGLAQLAHETTPALAQLCFTALLFYAAAALPYRPLIPGLAAAGGLLGLTLSGAPTVALLLGLGSALIYLRESPLGDVTQKHRQLRATGMAGMTLLCALLAFELNLWRWSLELPMWSQGDWPRLGRLFLWFTWPAWPLACWTVWRWRHQLRSARLNSRHLWIPLWFVGVASATTLVTSAADRALLLALPALATLAAFALPTLSRSMGALIDWFTLIFFSGCAIVIWVVWLSMQTGIPAKPALNVARLAPAFVHSFSPITFVIALIATAAWAWLVFWRTGRHRAALWKSVVLPAGGAALCWLLLMTLWLPLLDFARSYVPLVAQTTALMPQRPACVSTLGLSRGQIAAYTYHGELSLKPVIDVAECNWLLGDSAVLNYLSQTTDNWEFRGAVRHRGDPKEKLLLYQRQD
ncbi:MAG: hypothetical protein KAX57_06080 [Rhodoferax sp.]|jgi:hypothetical protein|uniref:hypothetical protein n=1 Tax=Rhodoferax sp. TaxID=50421 RepID=UPI001B752205|nr:hypothetical protein [Rhodoferax sp.]MBP8286392.1 hypothetical protein [Rhodoferax sp.]MBP9147205.1 hypothetical protein [Rhodoferax sp.]MBP9734191.1 hypothetical protein [Rhodoferax sp.]